MSGGLISPEQGAQGQISLCTSDSFEGTSGKYIADLVRALTPFQFTVIMRCSYTSWEIFLSMMFDIFYVMSR